MHAPHHNWIDGDPRPAVSGETFEVRIDGSRAALGRWPRSDPRDLDLAVEASERAARALQSLGQHGRRALLSDAIDALLDEPDPGGLAARALGLTSAEADVHVEPLEWALDDLLDGRDRSLLGQPGWARSGPLLHACEWSEMWLAPARATFAALLAGRTVILVSDAQAPMAADALARALVHFPAGAVNVLHDDGRTLLRAAAVDARIGTLGVASTSRAAAELAERTQAAPVEQDFGSGATLIPTTAFGSGIERAQAPALSVRRIANASFVVRPDVDLEDQARALVVRSFSRAHALSGARPGRAGRALCPVRSFSRFSEHVLDAIESSTDVRRPLGIVRALLVPEIERASRLGHDEGATEVFTGPEESEHGFPLVFTNVEERMRLAHMERPAPILCLMRAYDDAHARALAERLDAP